MKVKRLLQLFLAMVCISLIGCKAGLVPIGGIVDWYRPDASFPVPNGYMIADGSTVSDSDSPLNNKTLPDLRSKFTKGAATINQIGVTGGLASHSHGLNSATLTTSDVAEPPHWHTWAMFDRSTNRWKSYSGSSEKILVDWGDGIGSGGEGNWPLGFDQDNRPSGTGWFYLTTSDQSGITVHRHTVEFSSSVTTENSLSDPPYVMLLKIVRIK